MKVRKYNVKVRTQEVYYVRGQEVQHEGQEVQNEGQEVQLEGQQVGTYNVKVRRYNETVLEVQRERSQSFKSLEVGTPVTK